MVSSHLSTHPVLRGQIATPHAYVFYCDFDCAWQKHKERLGEVSKNMSENDSCLQKPSKTHRKMHQGISKDRLSMCGTSKAYSKFIRPKCSHWNPIGIIWDDGQPLAVASVLGLATLDPESTRGVFFSVAWPNDAQTITRFNLLPSIMKSSKTNAHHLRFEMEVKGICNQKKNLCQLQPMTKLFWSPLLRDRRGERRCERRGVRERRGGERVGERPDDASECFSPMQGPDAPTKYFHLSLVHDIHCYSQHLLFYCESWRNPIAACVTVEDHGLSYSWGPLRRLRFLERE